MSNLNQNTLSDIAASFKVLNKQISSFQKTIKLGLTDLTAELKKTKEDTNTTLKQLNVGIKQLSGIKQQIHVAVTNRPNINLKVNIENGGGGEGVGKEGLSFWEMLLAGMEIFNTVHDFGRNLGNIFKTPLDKIGGWTRKKFQVFKRYKRFQNYQNNKYGNIKPKTEKISNATSSDTAKNPTQATKDVSLRTDKEALKQSQANKQGSVEKKAQRFEDIAKQKAAKADKLSAKEGALSGHQKAELNKLRKEAKDANQAAERYRNAARQSTNVTSSQPKVIASKNTLSKSPVKKGIKLKKLGKFGAIAGLMGLAGGLGYSSNLSAATQENNEDSSNPPQDGFFSQALSFGSSLLSSPVVRTLGRVGLTGLRVARMATPLGWASLAAEAALSSDFVQNKISRFFGGSDSANDPELVKMDVGDMNKYIAMTPPNVAPNAAVGATSSTTHYNIHNKPNITINVASGTPNEIVNSVKNGVQQGLNSEKAMTRAVTGGLA